CRFCDVTPYANSCRFVLPTFAQPACSSSLTQPAVAGGTCSANTADPQGVRLPAVSKRSFTASRRPAGPSPSFVMKTFVMKTSVVSGVGSTEPPGSIQPEVDEPDADRAGEQDDEQPEQRPAPC